MNKITKYIKELFTGKRNFWEVFLVWGSIILIIIIILSLNIDKNTVYICFYTFPTIWLYLLIVNTIYNAKKKIIITIYKIIIIIIIMFIEFIMYYLAWTLRNGK
jgi:uncharacterized membrane protein YhaH (DUF805 family)